MDFALTDAQSKFQRLTDHIFRNFLFMLVYFEDLFILYDSLEAHVGHILEMFDLIALNVL